MIELLVSIIVICIIAGLFFWLVTLLPLPAPFPTVIQVCIVLILLLVLIGVTFGGVDVPVLRLRR